MHNQIKNIHLEITQRCQAACPMCMRNEGSSDSRYISNAEITLQDIQKTLSKELIQGLESFTMCGNLGDPITAKDTLDIYKYLRSINSNLFFVLITNGGAKTTDWWIELARVFGSRGVVNFSVDGLEDTNHIYRKNVSWSVVENSMRTFCKAGGRARWDYLVFEHNKHQVEEAKKLGESIGISEFRSKISHRFFYREDVKVVDDKTKQIVVIKPPTKEIKNKVQEVISEHGSKEAFLKETKVIECKSKRDQSIFISAEGDIFHCCWVGASLYYWWKPDRSEKIWKFIDLAGGKEFINIHSRSLDEILENRMFKDIESSWTNKEDRLEICEYQCSQDMSKFKTEKLKWS